MDLIQRVPRSWFQSSLSSSPVSKEVLGVQGQAGNQTDTCNSWLIFALKFHRGLEYVYPVRVYVRSLRSVSVLRVGYRTVALEKKRYETSLVVWGLRLHASTAGAGVQSLIGFHMPHTASQSKKRQSPHSPGADTNKSKKQMHQRISALEEDK